jgi:hypothetical protein
MNKKDVYVLRELSKEYLEYAGMPENTERIDLWTKMNDLKQERPMVLLYQVPWHEMNVNNELTVLSEDPFLKCIETNLRREIYRWKHMRVDMVIEPYIEVPLVIENSGFGISEDVDIVMADNASDVISRHFNIQIRDYEDIDKIKNPIVSYNRSESKRRLNIIKETVGDIIDVKAVGPHSVCFNTWDELIRFTGIQEILMDLALRPEYVHALVTRSFEAYNTILDQYEQLGILSTNNINKTVGQGGYGYTSDLPKMAVDDFTNSAKNLWGSAMAQIFSEVSPDMHEEFAYKYEMKAMERHGLTSYGCCEPLHRKIGFLRKLKNLRKISMSPWVDTKMGASEIGKDFVYSMKPNPALLARSPFDPIEVRAEIENCLKNTKEYGCSTEIILKDISTVKYDPKRLWQWADLVVDIAKNY